MTNSAMADAARYADGLPEELTMSDEKREKPDQQATAKPVTRSTESSKASSKFVDRTAEALGKGFGLTAPAPASKPRTKNDA
jgi:hypothetical protein